MENKLFFCINKAFILSRLLCFCCLFVGLYSCQEEDNTILNTGKLSFQMGVDTTLVGSSSTRASNILELSGFDDPDSYKVVISQDSGVVAEYARFDKMPAEIELEAGAYSVEVSKGTKTAAAFNSPYFSGKQDFTIVKDMTTPVEVTASMENSRVTVDFSDDFLETYEDYTLSFMTNKMTLPLVYEKGEYRPMYFQADASGTKLTIGMELVNVYGKDVQYTATTTIKQKQWTKLTVRTDEKGLNGVAIDVVLNDETKETVYVNIGIPDFMEQLKGAPIVTSSFFNWDGNATMTEPTILDPMDANTFKSIPNISVLAGGKVDKAILSVTKDGESVLNIDFANLEEEKKTELESLYAFDLPETIKGQMSFDFDPTGLLNSLMPKKDVNAEYVISLSVTDALPESNTTTKLVKVVLKEAQDPSFSGLDLIDGTYQKFTEQKSLRIVHTLDLASCSFVLTNSSEEIINRGEVDLVTGKTTVEGVDWRKMEDAYYLDFTPTWLNTLQSGMFTLSVTVEDIIGVKVVKDIPVSVAAIEWLTTENDVYAKHIILRAKALDRDISSIKFIYGDKIITEGLQDEGDGVVSYVLSGLTSGIENTVIVEHNGIQLRRTWKTEEELQLPNASMDEWTKEFICNNVGQEVLWFKGKDIDRWFPSSDKTKSFWKTNNEETTSNNPSPSFWLKAFPTVYSAAYAENYNPYKKLSFSGGSAAVICTVGWGDDLTWISGSLTNTAGRLFVENEKWETRPLGIKFKCQFESYNGEKFKVKVSLKDNSNNEVKIDQELSNENIQNGEVKLLFDSYLPQKAVSISIDFISSSSTSPSTQKVEGYNNDNLGGISESRAKDGGHNDSRNIGNVLIIDDVELIYDYE